MPRCTAFLNTICWNNETLVHMCCPKLHFSSSKGCLFGVSVFFCSFPPQKNRPNRPNQDLRETFKALDANGDGFLTVTELRDGIDKAGMETGGHGCSGWRWVIMLKPVSPKKIPKYKRGMVLWNKIGVIHDAWLWCTRWVDVRQKFK